MLSLVSKLKRKLPKVVFAAQYFYPMIGGAEHTANLLLQTLARHGYRSEVICLGKPRQFRFGNIFVRRTSEIEKVPKLLKQAKADVILTQLNLAPFVVGVARILSVPVILNVASYECYWPDLMAVAKNKGEGRYKRYELINKDVLRTQRWAMEKANIVCCASKYLARMVHKSYGRKAEILYPPIDDGPDYVGDPDSVKDRRYVTMCTALSFKGANVFSEIARRMPQEKFLAVGGRGQPQAYGLNRLPNVTCWGEKKPCEFYSVTKLLLVPSLCPESFGRVVLEAMANGIPVIASRVGGLPESVGRAGILMGDYKNPASWVMQINNMLNDKKRYRHYVCLGKKQYQGFTTEKLFPRFERMIRRLIKK